MTKKRFVFQKLDGSEPVIVEFDVPPVEYGGGYLLPKELLEDDEVKDDPNHH